MKRFFLMTILCLSVWCAFAQQEFTHAELLSFEDNQVLFKAQPDALLTLSDQHYKHGQQSLCWQWNKDSTSIVLDRPIAWFPNPKDAPDPSTYTFVFWVYGQTPQPQATLRFEFLKQSRVCSWFDYGLNFKGWRGAWVAFERDMQGKPEQDMEQLKITVTGSDKGTLYFDLIIPSSLQDLRQHTADTQAPYINKNTDSHWLINEKCLHYGFDLPTQPLTSKDIQEISKIEKKYTDFYLGEGKRIISTDVLRERLSKFSIKQNPDGTLQGKPLFFSRWGETYFSLGHPRNTKMFAQTVADLDDVNRLMLDMAVNYRISKDTSEQEEIRLMYLLLVRYLFDQGFVHGSSLGTIHHIGYSMRNFYTAFFLMKDVLYKENLGEEAQQAMAWFSNLAEVKRNPQVKGMDIDIFNTTLMARLGALLMLQDSPEKVTYLRSFVRWLNNGFAPSPGLTATFKVDGTVFHHCNNYPAYARDGIRGAVEAVYVLSQSDFAVSQVAHQQLKDALLTMRFYCNLRDWPLSMAGRHPKGTEGLQSEQFGLLALAGTPDGKFAIDSAMASAYLRLIQDKESLIKNNYGSLLQEKGIKAESSPVGNRSLPYASVMIQRRDNWSATVRGHSRYLWAAETYESANLYGRYLAHGNLQIVAKGNPVSNEGSGYQQKGWDWNYWWGTTVTVLPIEELKADVRNVDPFSGNEEMLYSDEAFAGSVSINNQNGVYAFKLHEHDKYNGSLRARKSYFFFDNRIICLGTDIESKIEQHPTVTTLFQEVIKPQESNIVLNKKSISEFPYYKEMTGNHCVEDAQGNAYFTHNALLSLRRSKQQSFDQATAQPTEGDFTVATISHGKAPSSQQYRYAILVQPDKQQKELWIKNHPSDKLYTVVQQNRQAHIVKDKVTNITGYVLFEAGKLSSDLLITENSVPCMAVVSEKNKKEVTLSVADPDLRFYEGAADEVYDQQGKRIERSIYSRPWIHNESKISNPQITLKGNWQLLTPHNNCKVITADKEKTVLEFTCQHGLSQQVKLEKCKMKK